MNKTHGLRGIPEYGAWATMISRCHNPNFDRYEFYGKRGIRVCSRWRKSFAAFISDMGRRPSPLHTIERNENDGNYTPDNCRWATRKEQAQNRRKRSPNKKPFFMDPLKRPRGENHHNSKLTEVDVRLIKTLHALGHTQTVVAKRMGVCRTVIRGIVNGTRWKHIGEKDGAK